MRAPSYSLALREALAASTEAPTSQNCSLTLALELEGAGSSNKHSDTANSLVSVVKSAVRVGCID